MIRVLLVDDSPIAITILKRILSKSPEIEVVGTAGNGLEGLKLIPQVKPDVICTDLHMPVMDGLEFTREVMARHPMPILLISVSGRVDSPNAFKVIEAGAVDMILKPKAGSDPEYEKLAAELIMKVRILSAVHVFRRTNLKAESGTGKTKAAEDLSIKLPDTTVRIIAIGASTGGPQALQTILSNLPFDFPLPIFCVQHICKDFSEGLVDWLSSKCHMKVEIAKAGIVPRAGTIYFPQEDTHLIIDDAGRVLLSTDPPCDGHRPSITITMNSISRYYGKSAIGVILTGMGRDGADGLLAIKNAGGITIAQDEASSIVFGMPKQAIELGAARYITPLDEIGPMILHIALNHAEHIRKT
jgi:two-component system chemotaxis response regulator CheB